MYKTWHPTCVLALLTLCAGCARYDRSRANHYDGASRPPVRKLAVLVDARNEYGASEGEIRNCVRRAVARAPQVVYRQRRSVDGRARPAANDPAGAMEEALHLAREAGADTACVVDVAECGWAFMVYALPPVWGLDNRLAYWIRVFDVPSGRLLVETRRSRHNGGMLAVSVPRLLPQLERGIREDLNPLLAAASAAETQPAQ